MAHVMFAALHRGSASSSKASSESFERHHSRRIRFDYHGRQFKVPDVHRTKASPRGGIQIVEVLPGRGAPEGNVVVEISSLADAARLPNTGTGAQRFSYCSPKHLTNRFSEPLTGVNHSAS
jgi:hypothetical protein